MVELKNTSNSLAKQIAIYLIGETNAAISTPNADNCTNILESISY